MCTTTACSTSVQKKKPLKSTVWLQNYLREVQLTRCQILLKKQKKENSLLIAILQVSLPSLIRFNASHKTKSELTLSN